MPHFDGGPPQGFPLEGPEQVDRGIEAAYREAQTAPEGVPMPDFASDPHYQFLGEFMSQKDARESARQVADEFGRESQYSQHSRASHDSDATMSGLGDEEEEYGELGLEYHGGSSDGDASQPTHTSRADGADLRGARHAGYDGRRSTKTDLSPSGDPARGRGRPADDPEERLAHARQFVIAALGAARSVKTEDDAPGPAVHDGRPSAPAQRRQQQQQQQQQRRPDDKRHEQALHFAMIALESASEHNRRRVGA